MTDYIKNFIEENIDLIELSDWENLFEIWYNSQTEFNSVKDRCRLNELFDILNTLEVTAAKTRNIREKIIYMQFEQYVQDKQNRGDSWTTPSGGINSLKSYLHLDLITLKSLFCKVCENKGLTPVDALKTRFRFK